MLKRVNIHIDEADLKKLDGIAMQIRKANNASWWTRNVSRADLIRYALTKTFNFEFDRSHTSVDILKKELKKVLKSTV